METRRFRGKTKVQTLLFDGKLWDPTSAQVWALDHKFKAHKIDQPAEYIRIRQAEPSTFRKDTFRTISFSDAKGIKAVVGVPKPVDYKKRAAAAKAKKMNRNNPKRRRNGTLDAYVPKKKTAPPHFTSHKIKKVALIRRKLNDGTFYTPGYSYRGLYLARHPVRGADGKTKVVGKAKSKKIAAVKRTGPWYVLHSTGKSLGMAPTLAGAKAFIHQIHKHQKGAGFAKAKTQKSALQHGNAVLDAYEYTYPRNNSRRRRRRNTHLKVGQRARYTKIPGIYGHVVRVRHDVDRYDVRWEQTGAIQKNVQGGDLAKA
jgi:hypothetical protein